MAASASLPPASTSLMLATGTFQKFLILSQRIEAPVRGGEGAPGSIPDGGPPVNQRFSEMDNILINNDGADEKAILGNGELVIRLYPACLIKSTCAWVEHIIAQLMRCEVQHLNSISI